MSQKISDIKTENLKNAFNPASFKVMYREEVTEEETRDEKKKKCENDLYNEALVGLETDMKNLGMDLTYTSTILISEVAMNILLLNRIKFQLICRGPLRERKILKKTHTSLEKSSDYSLKKSTSKWDFYDYFPANEETIHPLFDKLLPKLQKQINDGLKALGLLPSQTIERQKLVIIKKLRQKCESLGGEISIEAKKEIKNFN